MPWVSILKVIGIIAAQALGLGQALSPQLETAVKANPGAVVKPASALSEIETIFSKVIEQEGAFTAAFGTNSTGPQKALAVASIIGPDIEKAAAKFGIKPTDKEKAGKAVVAIAGAFADYVNAHLVK